MRDPVRIDFLPVLDLEDVAGWHRDARRQIDAVERARRPMLRGRTEKSTRRPSLATVEMRSVRRVKSASPELSVGERLRGERTAKRVCGRL
jgi:hypothetical protein